VKAEYEDFVGTVDEDLVSSGESSTCSYTR
jgi:hypothetical protein